MSLRAWSKISIFMEEHNPPYPRKTTIDTAPSSQRFATYAPLATLFLHLALLALSLAALRKSKTGSSTTAAARATTPGSEDGEKMVELDEIMNFPKDKA